MILAVDIGTSSCRAARFDGGGVRVEGSLVQRTYPLRTDGDGRAELESAELLAAVRECVDGAMAASAEPVEAVGMSCFWHSLIGVDAAGRALTPVITWADARCRADAEELRAELDEREVHAETGCMLRASFWPAKLRWLRRTQPEVFARVAYWISPAEWLQWQFTGAATCAIGMATGTGLFDPSTLRWSERMLAACGLREDQLLPVSDEASEWRGARWFPGIGDGAASNLGSGATRSGVGAINIGTSAALRVMREGTTEARAAFGLFCYRVDAARYLTGGAVSNAGNLFAWCGRELRLPEDLEERESALRERRTPDHGLTVLPFWTAERAPRWNEEDTGVIAGMRQATTALDVTQAVQEAFFYRLAAIAEMMEGAEGEGIRWVVSGGVLRSRAALERLANVLGAPIFVNVEPEASLRGGAVFALEQLGRLVPGLELGEAIEPEAEVSARYLEERRRQGQFEVLVGGWR